MFADALGSLQHFFQPLDHLLLVVVELGVLLPVADAVAGALDNVDLTLRSDGLHLFAHTGGLIERDAGVRRPVDEQVWRHEPC